MTRKQKILLDLEGIGGSDDDSLMYNERDGGVGVQPTDHDESEWEVDMKTKVENVRKRRCKKHFKEFGRYLCKDHKEILCPKCLV